MWKTDSGRIDRRRSLVSAVLWAAIMLCAEQSLAQESLLMEGPEKIDAKERISGNAVVGLKFQEVCDPFDPEDIHVYLGRPATHSSTMVELTTQLTTVDGRYVFGAKKRDVTPDNGWHRLDLRKKPREQDEDGSLDKKFLEKYKGEQWAILVSDETGRVYPVRCGCPNELKKIRIQVNAEGADAYFPQLLDGKRKLAPCTRVERGSNFKFDHYCDLELQDINGVEKFPIIRKRGATFDKRIDIQTLIPEELSCQTD